MKDLNAETQRRREKLILLPLRLCVSALRSFHQRARCFNRFIQRRDATVKLQLVNSPRDLANAWPRCEAQPYHVPPF